MKAKAYEFLIHSAVINIFLMHMQHKLLINNNNACNTEGKITECWFVVTESSFS